MLRFASLIFHSAHPYHTLLPLLMAPAQRSTTPISPPVRMVSFHRSLFFNSLVTPSSLAEHWTDVFDPLLAFRRGSFLMPSYGRNRFLSRESFDAPVPPPPQAVGPHPPRRSSPVFRSSHRRTAPGAIFVSIAPAPQVLFETLRAGALFNCRSFACR